MSIGLSRFGLLIALTVLVVEHAGRLEVGAVLEFAHRLGDLGVVMVVVGILGDAELGAQLRHARIFHHDCRPASCAAGVYFSAGPSAI